MRNTDMLRLYGICCMIVMFPDLCVAQSEDINDSLGVCRQIGDSTARLACYDAIGQKVPPNRTDNKMPEPAIATEVAANPVADDKFAAPPVENAVGESATAASGAPYKQKRTVEEFPVVVTACQRNDLDDVYFMLDNGDVLKQTGGKNLKRKDCRFTAMLTRDGFGYKMVIDDDGGTVRVKWMK